LAATAVRSADAFGSANDFEPLRGVLLDTRTGTTSDNATPKVIGVRPAATTTTVKVAGRIYVPQTATGATLTISIDAPAAAGYATVYPCGAERPLVSTINFASGKSISNTAIVALGTGGSVCVYNSAAAHVVLSLQGYYTSTAETALLTPARYMDTRPNEKTFDGTMQGIGAVSAGGNLTLPVGNRGQVPLNATSAIMTVAVKAIGSGYVTVWPCDVARPTASTINFVAGTIVANTVITSIGTDQSVCFYSSAQVHLIVDVTGYSDNKSNYRPLVPARLMDTRPGKSTIDGQEAGEGAFAANSSRLVDIAARGGLPGVPRAVMLNITITNPAASGLLRVRACNTGDQWEILFYAGQTIAKSAVVSVQAAGNICVSSSAATNVVIDVVGYYEY
ncbi:MAG: hypothetical protein ABMA25_29205, partial [Ilumatobacteraceae bacterium]